MNSYIALIVTIAMAAFMQQAYADVYMHNPRGSNDRNCEINVNRNNGNRLFDSQNNGKGGYACPRAVGGPEVVTPTMYYYVGSQLQVEWTNQHSCGGVNAYCDVVLQYMCEDTAPGIRDGTPEDEQDSATDTIPFDENDPSASDGERYGQHETWDYYKRCRTRRRNNNLFVADRNSRKLSRSQPATRTRQNENGNRNGLECPEERDYYPYWHPTPWKDIAVFTSNVSRCDFYRSESQNNRAKGDCRKSEAEIQEAMPYNNERECVENGGVWKLFAPHTNHNGDSLPDVECYDSSRIWSRDNSLGNTQSGHHANYNWTIPNDVHDKCVLRIRYNISTADYHPHEIDSTYNWEMTPIRQDQMNGEDKGYGWELANAINTNQYGRTFQDRSYVFSIRERPSDISPSAKIYNLNVRGKRGNIVQTFPAVEYDFVPQFLVMQGGEYLHIQWCGSDYNPNRNPNDAEGGPPYLGRHQARADRSNILQMDNSGLNLARKIDDVTMFLDERTGKPNYEVIKKLALVDQPIDEVDEDNQPKCLTYKQLRELGLRQNDAERDERNCGKLNGARTPYFDGGLVRMVATGHFKYYSSRNNNFSNRSQKGEVVVLNGWYAAAGHIQLSAAVLAVIGTVMALLM